MLLVTSEYYTNVGKTYKAIIIAKFVRVRVSTYSQIPSIKTRYSEATGRIVSEHRYLTLPRYSEGVGSSLVAGYMHFTIAGFACTYRL